MFNIASYIKTLKKYAKDRSISTEDFVRAIFEMLIDHYGIKNQRNEPLDLDKSRISKIMSGKSDVPQAIRAVLALADIEQTAEDEFTAFCYDYLEEATLQEAVTQIHSLIESDNEISEQVKTALRGNQNDPIKYLAASFLIAIKADNTLTKGSEAVLWSRGNSSVKLIFGDIFKFGFDNRMKTKNIVVIPVNTAFDTHISYNAETDACPVVSENTVHGQWVKRIIQSGISVETLDKRINESLRTQGTSQTGKCSSSNGKSVKYPIGSISVIDTKKATFYLLAVSEFDDNNIAHSTIDDIKKAIHRLLSFYNQNGQGYNLYMPLIGSGRSRAGMDYQDSLNEI